MNKPATNQAKRHNSLLDQQLYSLFSSLGRLSRRPISSLLTIGVIAIALALPAGFFVLLKNVSELTDSWRQSGAISVFLKTDQGSQQAQALADQYAALPEVSSVDILSPDQALQDLGQNADFGDAIAGLEQNPLPFVLTINPGPQGSDSFPQLAEQIEQHEHVDFAQFDLQWLIRFNAMLKVGQRLIEVIAAMLLLAVLLITGNTIRLDIESRREEIEIAKMLGATNGFIRRPFLYVGTWYGLLGAGCALALVQLALMLLSGPVQSLASSYGETDILHGPSPAEIAVLLAVGCLTSWLGAWISVSRDLHRIQPS